jgi:hypothetical protein
MKRIKFSKNNTPVFNILVRLRNAWAVNFTEEMWSNKKNERYTLENRSITYNTEW